MKTASGPYSNGIKSRGHIVLDVIELLEGEPKKCELTFAPGDLSYNDKRLLKGKGVRLITVNDYPRGDFKLTVI